MVNAEDDPAARLKVLSEMPGMPEDWRATMRAVLAGLDRDTRAVAAWDAADDEDVPVYDFIAACAALKQCFADRIAALDTHKAVAAQDVNIRIANLDRRYGHNDGSVG